QVTDETIETYLRPLLKTERRTTDFQRFLAAFDSGHTVAVEAQLRQLHTPTLIVWGTDDIYFDVRWSHWLAATIPGTRRRIELEGARIFFPEERASEFNRELRAHWLARSKLRCQTQRRRRRISGRCTFVDSHSYCSTVGIPVPRALLPRPARKQSRRVV